MHLDMLPSDYLIWGLVLALLIFMVWGSRYPHWRRPWAQVMTSGAGAAASIILLFYTLIGLTDSIRFRSTSTQSNSGLFSLLDWLVQPLGQQTEVTYSAPFSNYLFIQSIVELPNGEKVRGFPPLAHVHGNLHDIIFRASLGTGLGLMISLFLLTVFVFLYSHYKKQTLARQPESDFARKNPYRLARNVDNLDFFMDSRLRRRPFGYPLSYLRHR